MIMNKIVKEYSDVIKYDIEGMYDSFLIDNKADFMYHYKLAKVNFKDLMKLLKRKGI